MSIDQEKYRKAFELYRQWNEAKRSDRYRNAGKLSPEEAWRQYVELWEFCVNLNPDGGKGLHKLKMKNLEKYYARIEKFEEWRKTRFAEQA